MEAISSNSGVVNFALEVLHAMRLELSFVVFFGSLFLLNRCVYPKAPAGGKLASKLPQNRGVVRRPEVVREAEVTSRRRPLAAAAESGAPDEAILGLKHPTLQQLRDEEWFTKAALQLKSSQVQRTVDLYKSATKAGLDLSHLPGARADELFMGLVTAAIRANQPSEALEMLKACRRSGFDISVAVLSSATKLCTSKQFYRECLSIYDFISQDKQLVVDERSIWSCLLFCSVEARAYQRCSSFWEQMQSCGTPSNKDYGNMIRYASNQRDWNLTLSLIKEMRVKGVEVDNVVYNTALATCVAASQTDEARALLEEMEGSEGVVDVITYNTLAKGYAKAGRMESCFELYEHMRTRGIAPSQVTYGILLDCCINEKQMDKAVEVFNNMTQEGCVMNTVLYTTLIKGFARAGQVDQATKVYAKMLEDGTHGATPDLITFSILIKANCDAGRLPEALKLLEMMMELKLTPDEVVFNNLLSGCVQQSDDKLGRRLFRTMVEGGLRPSNATFSIMIRLYSSCKQLEDATELLRVEPQRWGVEPEPRLFVQLAQACLRERQGRAAIEVYSLMLNQTQPSPAMTSSLLAMCSKLNMLGTGIELLQLAAQAGANVDMKDASELKQSAIRKKKAQLVEQIDACMLSLQAGQRPSAAASRRPEF